MAANSTQQPLFTHVLFETSIGNFCIELYYKHAPNCCQSIAALAQAGFYDNVLVYRVVRNVLVQMGNLNSSSNNSNFEISRHLKHTGAGVVSLASNASSFYITLRPTPWLDNKHAVFGRVAFGMQVVQRMGLVTTADNDKPKQDITIYKATAHEGLPVTGISESQQLLITTEQ